MIINMSQISVIFPGYCFSIVISNRPYNVAIQTKPFPVTTLSTTKVASLTAVEAYIYKLLSCITINRWARKTWSLDVAWIVDRTTSQKTI